MTIHIYYLDIYGNVKSTSEDAAIPDEDVYILEANSTILKNYTKVDNFNINDTILYFSNRPQDTTTSFDTTSKEFELKIWIVAYKDIRRSITDSCNIGDIINRIYEMYSKEDENIIVHNNTKSHDPYFSDLNIPWYIQEMNKLIPGQISMLASIENN
jgi:hypothetical protein